MVERQKGKVIPKAKDIPKSKEIPNKGQKYIILARHGERIDDVHKVTDEERQLWKPYDFELDIPLSVNGHLMAQTTGQTISQRVSSLLLNSSDIKVYSSPYVRCIQTALGIVKGLGL